MMSFSHVLKRRVVCLLVHTRPDNAECTVRTRITVKGRHLSTKREIKKLKITSNPPSGGISDFIGPPDPKSNIRPVRFYIPSNETPTEKAFRLQRAEVLAWNQKFWEEHNSKFFKEKDDYLHKHQAGDTEDTKNSLSPEQMSVFYKRFLDENRLAHLNYNKEWYKKNISLLWPAFKVALIRLNRKLHRR